MSRNHRLQIAGLGVALMAVTLAGCDGSAPPVAPAASGNVEQVVAPAYVIGESVTVEGVVTRIISRGSFELDSPGFGDRSLLVVCAVDRDVNPGERIEVSATFSTSSMTPTRMSTGSRPMPRPMPLFRKSSFSSATKPWICPDRCSPRQWWLPASITTVAHSYGARSSDTPGEHRLAGRDRFGGRPSSLR
jgi:hypothetical protein